MRWFAYNVLFALAFLVALPRYVWRMCRRGGYARGFLQRFGVFDRGVGESLRAGGRVWVHAVSVGEMYVALAFLRELRARIPGQGFVLSTNTSTAHRIAEAQKREDVVLLYFPLDFPFIVRRVLSRVRPRALILVEGELWPNLLRAASRRGIPVAIVNGRMSDRSWRGYRSLRVFFEPLLRDLDMVLVQSAEDARRFVAAGARSERVRAMGSAKYDVALGGGSMPGDAAAILDACGLARTGPLLVGGSTWPGEERALINAHRTLREKHPGLRTVIVPRHAERGAEVEGLLRESGVPYVRRSVMAAPGCQAPASVEILLADTTGELRRFYASADVIFVGKSLTARGGQNIIEPAAAGKPVVVGPHLDNFRDVVADFSAAGAIVQVADEAGLTDALDRVLGDAAHRAELGRRAAEVVRAHCGVLGESVRLLAGLPALRLT